MANYVEYIKVGSGEAWPIRDPNAFQNTGGTISGNPLVHTSDDTGFTSYEGTQQGAIVTAYRDNSDQRRQLVINNVESENDVAHAAHITQTTDGANWQTYYLYGEHNKPTPANIGAAAAADHQLKTYSSLTQLGLSGGVTTIDAIAAMPVPSILLLYNSSANSDYLADAPTECCNIVLFKSNTEYGSGIATKINMPI